MLILLIVFWALCIWYAYITRNEHCKYLFLGVAFITAFYFFFIP